MMRGIDRLEILVAIAEPGQHAGAEILHHDVGLLGHLHDDRMDLAAFQVERDRALVAVPGEEVRALRAADPFGEEGHARNMSPGAGALDLDDIGAHVGEKLRGEGPLQQMAEIEDGDAGEGLVHN